MKIRLLVPWQQWSKGHVFTDMPGGQARTLIALNKAVEVRDEPSGPVKGLFAPVDRMLRKGRIANKAAEQGV